MKYAQKLGIILDFCSRVSHPTVFEKFRKKFSGNFKNNSWLQERWVIVVYFQCNCDFQRIFNNIKKSCIEQKNKMTKF